LVSKRSVKAVRIAISNFPSGSEAIYDAYNDLMERIEDQKQRSTRAWQQVLIRIVRAKRPLTALELQHALAVEFGTSGLDEDNVPQIEDMVSVCAGLVTVDKETSIIRLVHPTAQEYFERTQKQWFADAEADAYITTICLTYLAFDTDTFGSGICATFKDFEERLRANPFYNYAAKN
ncbi:ankyrin repeat protein, partial [Dactylonectria macrodidyma]